MVSSPTSTGHDFFATSSVYISNVSNTCVVKWPEMEKAIAANKGKVIVLDVWAEY